MLDKECYSLRKYRQKPLVILLHFLHYFKFSSEYVILYGKSDGYINVSSSENNTLHLKQLRSDKFKVKLFETSSNCISQFTENFLNALKLVVLHCHIRCFE